MAYGLQNGHVTDDVTWPWKVKLMTPIRLERNISKTTWARDFKFGMQLCIGNAERAFPESGRGLGHVTPQFLAYDWTYLRNYTAARDFKFGKRLWLIIIAFWLAGSAYYGPRWGSTVGYPSDSLAFCFLLVRLLDDGCKSRVVVVCAVSYKTEVYQRFFCEQDIVFIFVQLAVKYGQNYINCTQLSLLL